MEEKRMFQIKRGKYRGIIGIKTSTDEIKFELFQISGVYPKEEEMVYILKNFYSNSFYNDYWKDYNKNCDYRTVMEDIAEGKVLQRKYYKGFPEITKVVEFHISQYGNVTKLKAKNLTAIFYALDFNKELSKNNFGDYPEIKELRIQDGLEDWNSPLDIAKDLGLYNQSKEYKYKGFKYCVHTYEKKGKRYGFIEIPKEELQEYRNLFLSPYLPYEEIKDKYFVEILLRDTIETYIYSKPEENEEDTLLEYFINHYKNKDWDDYFLSTSFKLLPSLDYGLPRTEELEVDSEYDLKNLVNEFDRMIAVMLYLTGYKRNQKED